MSRSVDHSIQDSPKPVTHAMKYRSDIDGLRGVAVLLVVLFHAGFAYLPGGFVGVDVFFVISGYLITSIIVADVKQQRFSYVEFYERRVRRILPALYVMAILVLLATLFFQVPSDLDKTAKTLFFAILFSANIFFWRTTDYFSGDSDYEFFLHTWSLGVEEQFYFIFPVIILLFLHKANWLPRLVVIALAASFALSVYSSYYFEWASYYLLPSRAWQMMMGAFLAIVAVQHIRLNPHFVSFLSVVAAVLILLPAVWYTKHTRFPGVAALLPTLGAALVIFLGMVAPNNWIARFLRWRVLVAIGLISYSLYLWHWPIFAFLRNYYANTQLSTSAAIVGVACSFIAAYLSWRFVEAPFRHRSRFSRRAIYGLAAVVSLAILSLCALIVISKGFPSRIDPTVVRLSSVSESEVIGHACMQKTAAEVSRGNVCRIGLHSDNADAEENSEAGGEQAPLPSVVLWGDSHMGALKQEASFLLEKNRLSGLFTGKTGCPPLLGVLKTNIGGGKACLEFNQSVLALIESSASVTTVVLHSRWALSVEGSRYGAEKGPKYVLADTTTDEALLNVDVVERGLLRTVRALVAANKKVIVIASVPEIGVSVPKVIVNNLFWGKDRDIRPLRSDFTERQIRVNKVLSSLANQYPDLPIIFPAASLCDDSHCQIALDGEPLYFDDDHLSNLGARLVLKQLESAL